MHPGWTQAVVLIRALPRRDVTGVASRGRCPGRPRRRRRGRVRAPGRPVRGPAPRRRGAAAPRGRRRPAPTARGTSVGGLGRVRPQRQSQLVALGQGRRVRVLGHRHRPAHGIQPHQVGVDGGRLGGHRAEGRHVRHRQAGSRVDLGHAPRGEVAQRCPAGLELAAQGPGPLLVVGVGAAVGGTDDEVALGAGDVLLQRAQQAADVGAARDPGQHVGGAGVEPVEHRRNGGTLRGGFAVRRGRGPVRPRRAAHAPAPAGRPRTGRGPAGPAARRRGRRTAGRPRAARRPGLRPAPGRASPAARDAAAREVVASSRPQTRVERRASSVVPTRPLSQVATRRSCRSATAFHSAIESSRSLVYAAPSGAPRAAWSSTSSSALRSSRQVPRASR